ncbi:hypothetical protein [Melittangium boletus]|uniref:hypothetical protein n=1 Tax=Melittangium boletus TaxID=83453 RepID=UPI003DA63853
MLKHELSRVEAWDAAEDGGDRPDPPVEFDARESPRGLTPVFRAAHPPRGLSCFLRAVAYDIPEHHVKHGALLLLSDRMGVLQARLGTRPVRAAGLVLAALGGGWLLRRLRT